MKDLHCDICDLWDMIAWQAFTSYTCFSCGKWYSHPNTYVPSLCADCWNKSKRCIYCMWKIAKNKLPVDFKVLFRKVKWNWYEWHSKKASYEKDYRHNKIRKECKLPILAS